MKPVEHVVEEESDPIDEMVTAQLDNVEVPLPTPRPSSPKPPLAKKEPVKKPPLRKPPQQAKTPSQRADMPRLKAARASVVAARQSNTGVGATLSPAKWQARLFAHLKRHQRYPSGSKSRGDEGTVYVRFTIDTSGNVRAASLSRSSAFPELDREALAMVRRASPVPAPSPGAALTITAPLRFNLR